MVFAYIHVFGEREKSHTHHLLLLFHSIIGGSAAAAAAAAAFAARARIPLNNDNG
jgi:hypothetical protein